MYNVRYLCRQRRSLGNILRATEVVVFPGVCQVSSRNFVTPEHSHVVKVTVPDWCEDEVNTHIMRLDAPLSDF